MANTIKTEVSEHKPITGNYFTGEKRLSLDPGINFYKVDDDAKSDKGEQSEILVKPYIIQDASKKIQIKV